MTKSKAARSKKAIILHDEVIEFRHPAAKPPRGWRWILLSHTSPSRKVMYACSLCGNCTPGPTEWKYHRDSCKPITLKDGPAWDDPTDSTKLVCGPFPGVCVTMTEGELADKLRAAKLEAERAVFAAIRERLNMLTSSLGRLRNLNASHVPLQKQVRRFKAKIETVSLLLISLEMEAEKNANRPDDKDTLRKTADAVNAGASLFAGVKVK